MTRPHHAGSIARRLAPVLPMLGVAWFLASPALAQPQPQPQPQPQQPNAWLPQGAAVLQTLDKVNAQTSVMTVKTGQSAQFGALTIKVDACVVRPPDRPADAAAFLVITDQQGGTEGFKGWMLKSAPAVSMLQNPIYDVRVVGCAA